MDTIQEVLNSIELNGINFNWQSYADSVVKDEIIHYRHCKYNLAKTLGIRFPNDNLVDILTYCNKIDFTIESTGLHYLKSHRNYDSSHEWLYKLIKSYTQLEKYKSIRSSIKDSKIYSH